MAMGLLIPKKSEQGWVVDMTPEMARAAGVAEGSHVMLYVGEGGITAEMLPAATEEMKQSVRRFAEENADFLAEMKRLGD